MRKVWRRAWLAGGAAVVTVAVMALLAAAMPFGALSGRGDKVPVERVERGAFSRRVPAEGNLRATRSTPVIVPVGGRPFRVAWLAPEGGRVRAGEVVVRFDPTEIEKRLVDAEGDLASARFKAQKTQAENLAEIAKLAREAQVARIELANAKQFLKKDSLIFSRHEIIESELDQSLAQSHQEHAEGARGLRQGLARTDLDLLAIDIRQAGLKIQQARTSLAELAVRAPHDGVLILKRDWTATPVRVGDTVWPGQPLAEIPNLAEMEAEVYVLEADAGGLAVGKPAAVALESAPGLSCAARIARVDALAKPRLRGSPVQYFAVTLKLARTDPRVMKPGQRVSAMLLLDDRRDALVVPRQAVFQRDGRAVVYRWRGGGRGFETVGVALGPTGLGRSVIEKGLSAGDLVALRDPAHAGEAPPAGGASAPATGRTPAAPTVPLPR